MTETQILEGARIHPAGRASAGRRDARPGRRWGSLLWSLLHAQAVLDGTCGGPYDVAFIEDDRRRLAGPQGR
jgi:hypothetical protein